MLNANWLDISGGSTFSGTTSTGSTSLRISDNTGVWSYPYNGYTTYYVAPQYPTPIKLKLSEIERLRKAARTDEALRAILQKFTGHIEIQVDFE